MARIAEHFPVTNIECFKADDRLHLCCSNYLQTFVAQQKCGLKTTPNVAKTSCPKWRRVM